MDGHRVTRSRSGSVVNRSKINTGKQWVLTQLNNVAGRCNKSMTITGEQNIEVGYMDCKAYIYGDAPGESVEEGEYISAKSEHAEMNALSKFMDFYDDLDDIEMIEISAPPCKSCAFVLELLGLIGTVQTTKDIYKHATGSWHWPENLRNINLFSAGRWATVRHNFAGAGLNDQQILDTVIEVITSQSAL